MAKSIKSQPWFPHPSISCPSHFTHPSFQAPLLPPRAQRALSPYTEATASSGRPSPKNKRKWILVVSTFWLFHRRIKATPVHDTCRELQPILLWSLNRSDIQPRSTKVPHLLFLQIEISIKSNNITNMFWKNYHNDISSHIKRRTIKNNCSAQTSDSIKDLVISSHVKNTASPHTYRIYCDINKTLSLLP